jgi:hypothetical protein
MPSSRCSLLIAKWKFHDRNIVFSKKKKSYRFSKTYYNRKINEPKLSISNKKCVQTFLTASYGKRPLRKTRWKWEDAITIDVRGIDMKIWSRSNWLRGGQNNLSLWTRCWNFAFQNKILLVHWIATNCSRRPCTIEVRDLRTEKPAWLYQIWLRN